MEKIDALFSRWQKGYDIFSALDVMDNKSFLEKLKFTVSDKCLHYYLYNWACPSMSSDKVTIPAASPSAKSKAHYAFKAHAKVLPGVMPFDE